MDEAQDIDCQSPVNKAAVASGFDVQVIAPHVGSHDAEETRLMQGAAWSHSWGELVPREPCGAGQSRRSP